MFEIDPGDAIPIWKQIEDEIRRLIAIGRLAPDDSIPSVRDLARKLQVNPATVSKAYQELRSEGLLEVRRGEGTFVTTEPPKVKKSERKRAMGTAARRYASIAATAGAAVNEAVEEVESAFRRINPGKESSNGR